jgi:hypothetical protein
MANGTPIYAVHYEDKPIRKRYCNGVLFDEEYQSRDMHTYYEDQRIPEHRPKPENLIQSMTSQSPAYTDERYRGEAHAVKDDGACYPPGGGLGTLWYHSWGYPNTSSLPIATTWPSPDWMTPLRTKINDAYVNIGADVAEYRQTVDLFHDAGKAILDGWRALRGKARRRRRRKLSVCNIADAELMYSFGVAPLVGSVFDSYMALKHRIEGPVYFKHVQTAREVNVGTVSGGGIEKTSTMTVKCFAKVYVQYRAGPMITIGNPLSIAWELVPYSFMFDYMIPIGETLMALDALAGVVDMFGTVTTRKWLWEEAHAVDGFFSSGFNMEEGATPGTRDFYRHERQFITSIPLPPFPKWKPSASYKKLMHSVSLLVGANQRCRRR